MILNSSTSYIEYDRAENESFILRWNETQSVNCVAQGVITNGTDHVWISCTNYLGRGRFILDANGDPAEMEIHSWNVQALDGPIKHSKQQYAHIGDGDYVVLENGAHELWFGLEGGGSPRVLYAAIARYDADTLEFVNLHVHPSMKTMAYLAFHEHRQVAYTTNWTDNQGELIVFDASTLEWVDRNATVQGLPEEYQSDIPFIQGADMDGDILYLMVDDFRSSLIAIQMNDENEYGGQVLSVKHLGLGHEREGVSVYKDWLLSLDNQWQTWEDRHYAEIVCVSLARPRTSNRMLDLAVGAMLGLGVGLVVAWCLWRRNTLRAAVANAEPSYIEVVQQGNPLT